MRAGGRIAGSPAGSKASQASTSNHQIARTRRRLVRDTVAPQLADHLSSCRENMIALEKQLGNRRIRRQVSPGSRPSVCNRTDRRGSRQNLTLTAQAEFRLVAPDQRFAPPGSSLEQLAKTSRWSTDRTRREGRVPPHEPGQPNCRSRCSPALSSAWRHSCDLHLVRTNLVLTADIRLGTFCRRIAGPASSATLALSGVNRRRVVSSSFLRQSVEHTLATCPISRDHLLHLRRSGEMVGRPEYGPRPWRAIPSADPGQDRALASNYAARTDQESDLARKLLSTRRSRKPDRGLRRSL